jgi:glycine/D-amino acid oxidase-like deaminating enzyme
MFWERADPYLYGRSTDDGRVLVGGRDEAYRDPVRRRRALPSKLRALHAAAARRLPDVPLEVGYGWAGTFAETPDGLPYIGGHPAAPRCLFALGFGGNGITYSALAAAYLAAALTGAPDPEAALFRLDRPPRRPSAERRRPARAVARATRGRSRRPRRSAGRRVARPSLRGPGWRAACAS